jgi:osmotically-inducible protein OsmY
MGADAGEAIAPPGLAQTGGREVDMSMSESGADLARVPAAPMRVTGTLQSDEYIASRALGALERENLLEALRVELAVDHGWLTISGAAAHSVDRSAAECVVRYIPGVRGVTNRIVVALADRR